MHFCDIFLLSRIRIDGEEGIRPLVVPAGGGPVDCHGTYTPSLMLFKPIFLCQGQAEDGSCDSLQQVANIVCGSNGAESAGCKAVRGAASERSCAPAKTEAIADESISDDSVRSKLGDSNSAVASSTARFGQQGWQDLEGCLGDMALCRAKTFFAEHGLKADSSLTPNDLFLKYAKHAQQNVFGYCKNTLGVLNADFLLKMLPHPFKCRHVNQTFTQALESLLNTNIPDLASVQRASLMLGDT